MEAEFRYFDGQQEWVWRQEPSSPETAARTVAMLGASITSFESSENGTLGLTFFKWASPDHTGFIPGVRIVRHYPTRPDHHRLERIFPIPPAYRDVRVL